MRHAACAIARSLLAVAALAAAPFVNAIDIEGLSPLTPLVLYGVSASVEEGKLEIYHENGYFSIHPWPEFLPAKLTDQQIQAQRQVWPAGPSDLASFIREGEQRPWLIIGSHSRSGTPVLGKWTLQHADGRWYVSDGNQTVLLFESAGSRAPIRLLACGERWEVYPLAVTRESPSGTASVESESRISWAAVHP